MTNRFVHHVPFPYIDVMSKKGRMKGLMCLINLYELTHIAACTQPVHALMCKFS